MSLSMAFRPSLSALALIRAGRHFPAHDPFPVAVSEYLGHSSTAITTDIYVHESLEKAQRVPRAFEGL